MDLRLIHGPREGDDDADDARGERPSKSRRKRDMHALQALGERLVALPPEVLRRVEVPPELREAIEEARRITSHEGRRRQLQYVGRLMRNVDPEPIRASLELATGESREAVARMHRCEQLRERLIDDDAALTELMRETPEADAQWLRATIRAARRERSDGRPPRHARELYRWLHQNLQGTSE
ncbi:MAG TPA: ribosome biogenesis factor YjgA [Burkholderiaceae bacterium]|nr:ribosome biogenesis factor YjgA [Burkholderiaceae bacterium]